MPAAATPIATASPGRDTSNDRRPADPWRLRAEDHPAGARSGDQLRSAIGWAQLAPSSHNAQPWRFRVASDHVDVVMDESRRLAVSDPDGREQTISCACAAEFLLIALRRFGHAVDLMALPEPGTIARVALRGRRAPRACEIELFDAITARRTNRLGFEDLPVRGDLLDELRTEVADVGAWLADVGAPDTRAAVADLVEEGDHRQRVTPAYRRELATWIRGNHATDRDGMPGYAHGLGDAAAALGPAVVRWFGPPGMEANDRRATLEAPLLAVIGTPGDERRHWVAAGRALARLLLRAQVSGVEAAYLNSVVQVPDTRARLRALTGRPGAPQLLVRMGYGRPARATPRRALSEVLA